MFVDDQQFIEVVLYYYQPRKKQGMRVVINYDDIPKGMDKRYNKLTLLMRPMTWKIYNDLLRSSRLVEGVAEGTDWIGYKEKKLIALLATWDFPGKDGQPVEVTAENILSLHPLIAEMALQAYDRLVYAEGDEDESSEPNGDEQAELNVRVDSAAARPVATSRPKMAPIVAKIEPPAPMPVVRASNEAPTATEVESPTGESIVMAPPPPAQFLKDMAERKARAEAARAAVNKAK